MSPEGFSSISPVNNVTLNRGDDITLQCTTTAGPDNKFKWFQIVASENVTGKVKDTEFIVLKFCF